MADSKREATIALDEWDVARPAWLTPMDTCMIEFRLNARGGIEFAQFGYETADFVWKNCYAALMKCSHAMPVTALRRPSRRSRRP